MLKLWKFKWDCGRMGYVRGLFVCTQAELDTALGREVYFGEILGKHSEIYGTLGEEDLTLVSEDQEKIQWLVEVIGSPTISGYNPLEYLPEDEDEDGDEEE